MGMTRIATTQSPSGTVLASEVLTQVEAFMERRDMSTHDLDRFVMARFDGCGTTFKEGTVRTLVARLARQRYVRIGVADTLLTAIGSHLWTLASYKDTIDHDTSSLVLDDDDWGPENVTGPFSEHPVPDPPPGLFPAWDMEVAARRCGEGEQLTLLLAA